MSTYAILGATGQVGRTVLKGLLERSQTESETTQQSKIHVLVRSESKFEKQLKTSEFASLDRSAIHVFESSDISNIDILSQCIRDTKAVFLCVAAPNNKPGCSIAQDQSKAAIAALRQIKDNSNGQTSKLPRLVVLSSAEAEETPYLSANIPWLMRNILFTANSNVYKDLIAAEKLLRAESDWVEFAIMKPGGLSWDIARGHQLSLDHQQTFISYADLINGMIEVADASSGRYDGKCVSVVVPGGKAKAAYENGPLLLKGILVHFIPWLYGWLF